MMSSGDIKITSLGKYICLILTPTHSFVDYKTIYLPDLLHNLYYFNPSQNTKAWSLFVIY